MHNLFIFLFTWIYIYKSYKLFTMHLKIRTIKTIIKLKIVFVKYFQKLFNIELTMFPITA